ncbi:hypothetical protein NGA_0459700, partial [Nannochloropsis gaditana CCMP526]
TVQRIFTSCSTCICWCPRQPPSRGNSIYRKRYGGCGGAVGVARRSQ